MHIRAVLFDLGGVVLGSPMHAITRFENANKIPPGFVNRLIGERGGDGAWGRLERGKLDLEAFFPAFEAECAEAGQPLDASAMFQHMGEATKPRPAMLHAIARIRAAGLTVAALTNNWASAKRDDATPALRDHFDHFFESSVLGLQKPDPKIYEYVCAEIGIPANAIAFLDDIGRNLKPARALGMTTIRVEAPDAALTELETLLGFSLA